ncbi:MAG TPA: class II fructose-bisphosphate aldolase [Vicinamibacteria bacterium]|nr:class II fructose-bisphosphate aldolase [Vicinamibacteria bacterium]
MLRTARGSIGHERTVAYPAINVTSLNTANAVLKGLSESRSDGIIQVSTGGRLRGGAVFKNMVQKHH